jgi:ABC-type sugar transport system permease subunit
MVVYPLVFTVYTAFTNYSDSHLLTKRQVIRVLEKEEYLPEGAAVYRWTAFRSPAGDYMLWLVSEDGKTLLARLREPVREVPSEAKIGPLGDDGIPQNIEDYERLSRVDSVRFLPELSRLKFGEPPNTIKITSLDKAGQFQQRYIYDPSQDALVDQKTGTVYRAVGGFFTSPEGETLQPGFQVPIGWRNFHRLFTSRALQWPLIRIFLWTVAFALLAVVTTFVLGLFLALVFNDPTMPGRKLIRSIFLIPNAVPYFLSILTWRGMLNPHVGIISRILEMLIGWSPPWLSDQWWTRVAIVFFVNLWLGFPYMMLISSGALQAIPSEIYEAAEVDGASTWQRFWHITLPLLLGIVAPLLVFSFAFNFNNFGVIYLFNRGGPPMPYTITPAGHTDILISYSYRLAFESGRGGDYGYAASITIIIFIVLAAITLFQFRYARMREKVFEGV